MVSHAGFLHQISGVGYPTGWRSVKIIKDENKQTNKKKVLKRGREGDTKWRRKVAVNYSFEFLGGDDLLLEEFH